MADVTLLYNLPLIVRIDTEEKVVTSVVEDVDNIALARDLFSGPIAWEGQDDDQFWRQMDTSSLGDDRTLAEVAEEIAESEFWPARDS
jgi:hypothetical protein